MKSEPRSLLPVSVAARRLGIHPKTYDRWLAEGRSIPKPVLVEGERRIVTDELEAFIEERKRARDSQRRGERGAPKSGVFETPSPRSES